MKGEMMKIEDKDQYRLGYAQGYYDAVKQIARRDRAEEEWARDTLQAVISDVLESEE